jgi:tetratricopeptide (TPR) repeat protein
MVQARFRFAIVLALIWAPVAFGQAVNQRVTAADGRQDLLGTLTEVGLRSAPFNEWYDAGVASYQPDEQILHQLNLSDYEITVFMGTWCGDSRREVPRLMRTLRELNYPSSQLAIIGVNRTREQFKQSPGGEEAGRNIHRVPTIIVQRDGVEIGRIVESPVASIEADLHAITSEAGYTGQYEVVARLHALLMDQEAAAVPADPAAMAQELQPVAQGSAELRGYGYMQLYQNQIDRAVTTFEVNQRLFPDDAVVYESLAEAYLEQGDIEQAAQNARRALERSPGNENMRRMLVDIQAR